MQLFLEFTGILLLATVVSLVMRLLRQPLVIGYILTGIILGPQFLHVLHGNDYIELFSKIGITILLFIVGLNLSPQVVREVGKVSFLGGLGQILLTTLYGYLIAKSFGASYLDALYIGIALAFSSTIIILKILSDKNELYKLHGKVSVGLLLVQDLVAMLLLILLSSFTSNTGVQTDYLSVVSLLVIKTVIIFVLLFFISRYIIFKLIRSIAHSQELLFLFSLAWGMGLSAIFYQVGLSVEVGALVAGVTLSVSSFADGIASRLKPLRDFFIVLFFILLGSQIVFHTLQDILLPALLLSLFVLIGKPLIVFWLMNLLGYKTRTSFETGINLAQVSEFSLILATLGVSLGHISSDTLSLITLVALITIAGSSYLMFQSDIVYEWLQSILKVIEFKNNKRETVAQQKAHELILFGFDNVGQDFLHVFSKLERDYIVIDMNPKLIEQLQDSEVPHKYGDMEDIELLEELNFRTVKMCVSTIPDFKANSLLIKTVRKVNKQAIVIVRAHEREEAKRLYELGASYVVMPHYLGAKYATQMITRLGLDKKGFDEEREKHLLQVNKL